MPTARHKLIFPDITRYYHCTSRCVRRAFLCGRDSVSGRDYSHRKSWIEKRILFLARVTSVDVAAYAVMSNHYHVVLYIDLERAERWSEEEVVNRWRRLYRVPRLVDTYLNDIDLDARDADIARSWISTRRRRLTSISWFMRLINEPLARRANAEDDCTGRFWEGRFDSQALLDERALLTCMTYVDLNPIRAGLSTTPESSAHTSVRARIGGEAALMPLMDEPTDRSTKKKSLPISYRSYLELVDWSGRLLKADKRGAIPPCEPNILRRLEPPSEWRTTLRHYGSWYRRFVGSEDKLQEVCARLGQRWLQRIVRPSRPTGAAPLQLAD